MKCQIYGERCSGTNYLEQLMAKNFPCLEISWEYGWKHFFHREGVEQAKDHLFIIIHRNPFDWIKSLHKHPWHTAPELRGLPVSEFIRKEWKCIWDEDAQKTPDDPLYHTEMLFERCLFTNKRFDNVLKMRSAKIRNWQSLQNKVPNFIHVQYEQLQSDPETFLHNLSKSFPIGPLQPFMNVESYKGLKTETYTPRKYPPLPKKDIDFIVKELEEETERSIGYSLRALALAESQLR